MSTLFVYLLLFLSAVALASSSNTSNGQSSTQRRSGGYNPFDDSPSSTQIPVNRLSGTITGFSGQWESLLGDPQPQPLNNSNPTSVVRRSNNNPFLIEEEPSSAAPVQQLGRRETVSHSDANLAGPVRPSTGNRGEANTAVSPGQGKTQPANQNAASTRPVSGENQNQGPPQQTAKASCSSSQAMVPHQSDSKKMIGFTCALCGTKSNSQMQLESHQTFYCPNRQQAQLEDNPAVEKAIERGFAESGKMRESNPNTAYPKSVAPQAIVLHQSDPGKVHISSPSRPSGLRIDPTFLYRGPEIPTVRIREKYLIQSDREKVERAYIAELDFAKKEIRANMGVADIKTLLDLELKPIGLNEMNRAFVNPRNYCIQDSAIEALQFCYPEYNISPEGKFSPISFDHDFPSIFVILPHIVNMPGPDKKIRELREVARAKQNVIKCTYANARVYDLRNKGLKKDEKTLELYMADNWKGEVFYFYPFDSGKNTFMPILLGKRGENAKKVMGFPSTTFKEEHYDRKAKQLCRKRSVGEEDLAAIVTENATAEDRLRAEPFGDVASARGSPASAMKMKNEPNTSVTNQSGKAPKAGGKIADPSASPVDSRKSRFGFGK